MGTTRYAGSDASDGRPVDHLSQYPDLTRKWNTDRTSTSISSELLKRGKRHIGQHVCFDSKPLGIGMCYCCGAILWSRVDNSHTTLTLY